jgi:hypothetical protein
LNGYTPEFHREFIKKYEKFHKLSEKPETELVEKILFVPFVIGFIATAYLFMGMFTPAFKLALIVGGISAIVFLIFFGAFAFRVLYGSFRFEKFLLKHFSSEKVDFLLSGKTFGKEHLSEKIRQIKENENFSDESFYNEMKIFIEGEENGK